MASVSAKPPGPRGPDQPPAADKPVFWQELYWFALLSLGGFMVAVLVLAPRLARDRDTADVEGELHHVASQLASLEEEYQAAIEAVENDPFYRDEVIRKVLKVKKKNEEFLKKGLGNSDNHRR